MTEDISIIFGSRTSLDATVSPNTVLIVPSQNTYNDFGYRTKVDVSIQVPGVDVPYCTEAFIGFVVSLPDDSGYLKRFADEENGVELLEQILQQVGGVSLPATKQHRFFTMLPTMDHYRRIVLTLGVEGSTKVLIAMRDIVATKEFKLNSDWMNLASSTDVFVKSFLRNSESYFAYRNAASVLRGLQFEQFRNLSKELNINFQLSGLKNAHDLTFRFDHEADLPKRIAVIIGKNGVGKSQTLGRIVRAALAGDGCLRDGETGGRILVNRILAFAPTNEAGSVFPTDRRKRPKIWYQRFSLNRSGVSRNELGISDLVVQVARSDGHIGESSRWDIFLNALQAIENWDQICLPLKDRESNPIPLSDMLKGGEMVVLEKLSTVDVRKEPVRLINGFSYQLSSGEISFVRFSAQVSLHVENGSLLLLDEPETHLHPNFISQFVSLLDRLLAETGSAAIIATHSVYFVREVFQDQVMVLRNDQDGYVNVELPTLRTFGADVGAISYFVFGEDEPSQLAMKAIKALLIKCKNWEEAYAQYKNILSLEMLGALRESMEAAIEHE